MPAYVEHLLFDRDEWRRRIADEVTPVLTGLLVDGAARGAVIAEEIGFVGAFDIESPQIQAFVRGYRFKFAERIADTAAEHMREIMATGLESGQTIRELRQAIMADPVIGPEADKYRAEMIARTESVRATGEGQAESWRETNRAALVEGMAPPFTGEIWRTSPEACAFCVDMDGKITQIDEAYFPQGGEFVLEGVGRMSFGYEAVERPPLHPNCRCDSDPIIAAEYGG
ncbi:MAG: phage minor head protein [Vicinamibacterales bacterium]|nr:phage minor head protein [Vicinamibacterales bacterium]